MPQFAIDCRYVRERPSGIGAYVAALVDRLPAMAPEIQFTFWAHRLARRPLSTAPNVAEVTVPLEPNSLWPLCWPERYASFDHVDLFHCPHNVLPRGLRCPSVVTIHDLMALERPDLAFTHWDQIAKRFYYPRALTRALRKATRLIAITSVTADRIVQLHPAARGRVVVIAQAAGPDFQPAPDRDAVRMQVAERIGSTAPYFLVVGQNSPSKRHGVAMEAFARHVPEPWRLVLVQRQTHDHPLQKLAQSLGIEERITWIPHLDHVDLVRLYQCATALVHPSIYEGFGLPVIEAMACACPVVVSDIPTLREVVGEAGILVAPDDVDQLGRELVDLARSTPRQQQLSGTALARAGKFSWDRCARETLAVLRDAAASAPA
jgi:glycosyltransferase involved in cell wall biosynthesis